MRHVYGPVPSRRLGRSLGIDLVPFKTCTYDCIYCQLGRTTHKTVDLREYVPVADVLRQLASALAAGPRPDYIGLAGSGEPTLHARMGDLIAGIKRLTTIPVAVLTNGSMLWAPEVRACLAEADLVMPSLDAGNARAFEQVNRPHPDISFDRMVGGLAAFAESFGGEIWLEVFVLGGITDQVEELSQIAAIARTLRPARVQLNTVSRPPAEADALAVPAEALARLAGLFAGTCEIIAEAPRGKPAAPAESVAGRSAGEEILALLARRPCTVEGISDGLGLPPNEVVKHLDALRRLGAVRAVSIADGVFYQSAAGPGDAQAQHAVPPEQEA